HPASASFIFKFLFHYRQYNCFAGSLCSGRLSARVKFAHSRFRRMRLNDLNHLNGSKFGAAQRRTTENPFSNSQILKFSNFQILPIRASRSFVPSAPKPYLYHMTTKHLTQQIREKKSFLCIGLDVDLEKVPAHLANAEFPMFEFNKAIIDATHDLAVAYKPNTAFYEAQGVKGWQSLIKT